MPRSSVSATTIPVAFAACAIAVVGIAAAWAGLTLAFGSLCGWIAVLAALDAALLLRLAGWPAGRSRVTLALLVLGATLLLAGYFIATAQIGRAMGLRPFESLPNMSLELAALYLRSNLGWAEAAWSALAAVVAWRSAR